MTEANTLRQTVNSSGAVTVRQRPALLLMKTPVLADESTLELGLTKLKAQCEATSRWLNRLGAVRVEVGEPHFADQGDRDPMVKMQNLARRAARRRPAQASTRQRAGVRAVLTATWEIASMSAEEIIILLDRLRFEVAGDSNSTEAPDEPSQWAAPEEQLRDLMAQFQQPPVDDTAPVFLFVARLEAEQLEKAMAEAFSRARESAERLARAAGLRLGPLATVFANPHAPDPARSYKLIEQQRCMSLLDGCSYELRDNECVSDDPRTTGFIVSVNVSYYLE